MKWCRFRDGTESRYGYVDVDVVVAVDGSPFGEYRETGAVHPLDDVRLDIPVQPPTFYCVGVNYEDHVVRSAARRGKEPVFPAKPDINYRANSALIAHGEPIVKPADSGENFQYEGELVAVFGKTARHVSPDEALSCVLGWTIGNDVSERDWQKIDRTLWRAKNSDTFKPMGPWIETDADLDAMWTTVRLNGEVVDKFKTDNMIFDAATYISEVSKYCTIRPGDVMWMGTDGLPRNMTVGDVVEIDISGIGTLRNPIVGEGA